jgi:MFS family permease
MVCKLWAGLLVDRFGAVRLVPLMCLPFGLGLLLLFYFDTTATAILFMVLMGITIGVYATLSSPFFSELYGTLHLGAIKSMTTAAMVFATAVAPVLMGRMIDLGVSMEAMALVSAVYIAVASALAFYACRWRLAARAARP